jgi:hypothetical protein
VTLSVKEGQERERKEDSREGEKKGRRRKTKRIKANEERSVRNGGL